MCARQPGEANTRQATPAATGEGTEVPSRLELTAQAVARVAHEPLDPLEDEPWTSAAPVVERD